MNSKIVTIGCVLGLLIPQVQAASDTEQRLERLERRVGLITELTLEVEGLKRENRHLQGRLEEQQHVIDNLRRKQRELYLDVDERLTRLQSGVSATPRLPAIPGADSEQPNASATREAPGSTASSVSTLPPGDPAKEEAAYAAAYDLLRPEQRRYQEAIEALQLFIRQYPDGKLTDNARYWLGEANYVTQDNEAALTAFREVLQHHPRSSKAPGALLKIGYIQAAMGDTAGANTSLQRVIDDYPTSSAAGMAKQRLVNMQRRSE